MERYIFIFMFGLLVFGWPLLAIFQSGLVSYLYGMWLAYIIVLAVATRNFGDTKKAAGNRQGGDQG